MHALFDYMFMPMLLSGILLAIHGRYLQLTSGNDQERDRRGKLEYFISALICLAAILWLQINARN